MNEIGSLGLRPFGDVYLANEASMETIASAITEVSTSFGFESEQSADPSTIRVTGAQSAAWHRIVRKALPQRLEWELWTSGSHAFLRFDRPSVPWYRVFSVVACIMSAVWLWVACVAGVSAGGWLIAVAGLNVLAAFGLLTLAARWCLAGGQGVVDRLWDQLHDRLAGRGIQLDHRPELSRSRLQRTGRRLLAFILAEAGLLVVAMTWLSSSSIRRAPSWLLVALLLFILIVVVLGWVLVRGTRKPGFEQRTRLVLPGICGLFFMMFLVAGQLPAHLLTRYPADAWDSLFSARDMLDRAPATASTITTPSRRVVAVAELRGMLTTMKVILAMPIVIIPIGAAMGALACIPTLRLLDVLLRHSGRLSTAAHLATVRSTVSGRGFMGRFRASLFLCWFGASALVFWGFTQLAISAARSTGVLNPTSSTSDVAGAVAHALRFVFDLAPYNLAAEVVARWFWCAWAWMVFTLLGLSCGTWLARRLATRRELEELLASALPGATRAIEVATSVISATGQRNPHIVVKPDSFPRAASFEFGLLRRSQYILVSDSCLGLLTPEELAAVIAHEWSHLVLGHCRKHNILQVLGRLTFVGDSFTNAIEQSFRYELEADRCAVDRFGVPKQTIRNCLLKLRAVATLQRLRHSLPATTGAGLAMSQPGSSATPRSRRGPRWTALDSIRLWVQLYTGDTMAAYWHPAVDERIQRLC